MNISPPHFLPVARKDEIVSREVEGELLIYDRLRDKAHCLNDSAAAIWKRCDGRSTIAQIAQSIALQSGGSADENFVQLGLDELSERHLLEQARPRTKARPTLSRREAVRRIGLGAAIALPIVITITAPTPAQAGSCRGAGVSCGTGSQCCSGTCSGGSCLGGFANPQDRTRRRS
jgi:hypothetical protein